MSRPQTVYLVDGSGQFHRAFPAIRGLATSKGLPPNATYGFTTMLRKLLEVSLCIRPYDQAMDEAGEDLGGVMNTLAAPDLDVVRVEKKRIAAQLVDRDAIDLAHLRRGREDHVAAPVTITPRSAFR